MDAFHAHFRLAFRGIYDRAGHVDAEAEDELSDLVAEGESLVHHLHMHHSIEVLSQPCDLSPRSRADLAR